MALDVVQLLADLVACASPNPRRSPVSAQYPGEANLLRLLGDILRPLGARVTLEEAMPGRHNLLAFFDGVDASRTLLLAAHADTVPQDGMTIPPFTPEIRDGRLYGRGACDEKGSTPGMVYGLAIAKQLGLLEGWTAWYFGNMEEWCDGIAPNTFVEVDPGVKPDFVVIGEPTKMQVYRGHKGRIELQVISKGRSAHAASNHLGDNAI